MEIVLYFDKIRKLNIILFVLILKFITICEETLNDKFICLPINTLAAITHTAPGSLYSFKMSKPIACRENSACIDILHGTRRDQRVKFASRKRLSRKYST